MDCPSKCHDSRLLRLLINASKDHVLTLHVRVANIVCEISSHYYLTTGEIVPGEEQEVERLNKLKEEITSDICTLEYFIFTASNASMICRTASSEEYNVIKKGTP
jgi:hypothetical protein